MQDYSECRDTPGNLQWKYGRQQTETAQKEIPDRQKKKIYHHDRDRTVKQVSQRGWGLNPGGLQDLAE